MKPVTRTTEFLAVDGIVVAGRLRDLRADAVDTLAESMRVTGMRTPISIRMTSEEDGYDAVLVTGLHRLEAARRLGWQKIECFVVETEDEDEARRWEIAENLHRCELTVQERSEHISEWLRLTDKIGQLGQFSRVGAGRGNKGGTSAAAREIGVGRKEAERSQKIDALAPEAKSAARETGLDDNQSALSLAASKPLSEQAATLRAIHQAGNVTAFKAAADPSSDAQALEKQVAKLMAAWNAACPDARQEFLGRIDQPIMDRRFA